jgi:hypothetical protein
MGSISFLLPDPIPPVAERTLSKACFAVCYDFVPMPTPMPTELIFENNRLIVNRELNESGNLLVPWPIEPFGTLIASTSTLRESDEPYRLLIELARGKINQVRMQSAEWHGIGLQFPEGFEVEMATTTRLFAKAVLSNDSGEADRLATEVLTHSFRLADTLTRAFMTQMFDTRHQEDGLLDVRLAARYTGDIRDSISEYSRSFNAAQIAFHWRDVEPEESRYEWTELDRAISIARDSELPITAGPVIDLAPGLLPSWAAGWEGDLPTLAAFMCDYLETVIGRYKSDVRRWVVCAGFNHADALGLDDDQRLRLALRLFEAAAQIDPDIELILSIAQPWGDYLVDENLTISPLTFPDDLIRAGARLAVVELEIRKGNTVRSSWPHDLLDTSRMVNLYGLLGVPIEVVLSHPSSVEGDPASLVLEQSPWIPTGLSDSTLENQAEWGSTIAAMALCMPHVRAVTWDHWSDAIPHLSPNGGLLDHQGRPKPLLSRLRTLRTAHLR